MAKTRVLLADDHALFRQGVSSILAAQPDFEIAGEAADGLEAVAMARALQPDLILMDINMPSCNGLEATRAIRAGLPEARIVMLTVHEEDEKLFEAIRSGASGYLPKNTPPRDFLRLVRGVMAGEAAITPAMAARLLAEFGRTAPASPAAPGGEPLAPLTRREREVLSLVANGATDQEVAEALTISLHTAKVHMRHILAKLHASGRKEAAAYARRAGLLDTTP